MTWLYKKANEEAVRVIDHHRNCDTAIDIADIRDAIEQVAWCFAERIGDNLIDYVEGQDRNLISAAIAKANKEDK